MGHRSHLILALSVSAVVSGLACEALAPAVMEGARQFLVGTASQNYQSNYTDSLEKMVDILLKLRRMNLVFGEVPLLLRYDRKRGRSKMTVGRTTRKTLALLLRRRLSV